MYKELFDKNMLIFYSITLQN